MKLQTLFIAAVVLSGATAGSAVAQVNFVSQSRYVRANPPGCDLQYFAAPDFGPFNRTAHVDCATGSATARQNSTLSPSAIHVDYHIESFGPGASTEFNVVFDVSSAVAYTLNVSAAGVASGTLTGPGTSITFGANGVTSASGVLLPGRYTVYSSSDLMYPDLPTLNFDLSFQSLPFAVDWSTLDCGGGTVSGGTFEISGTIGQPDSGYAEAPLSGDSFRIVGGFWTVIRPTCSADFDGDGFITGQDFDLYVLAFENGDTTADFDEDGFVTGQDFDLFVQAYEAGCE